MAVFAATDYRIELNSVVLSDHCTSAELPISVDKLETTAFGDTWEDSIGGIKRATASLTFNQDYASSNVDATIWGALGTVVTLKVRPTSGSISATNPEYQCSVLVNDHKPVAAGVGQLGTLSITWPVSGTVTRATS